MEIQCKIQCAIALQAINFDSSIYGICLAHSSCARQPSHEFSRKGVNPTESFGNTNATLSPRWVQSVNHYERIRMMSFTLTRLEFTFVTFLFRAQKPSIIISALIFVTNNSQFIQLWLCASSLNNNHNFRNSKEPPSGYTRNIDRSE